MTRSAAISRVRDARYCGAALAQLEGASVDLVSTLLTDGHIFPSVSTKKRAEGEAAAGATVT